MYRGQFAWLATAIALFTASPSTYNNTVTWTHAINVLSGFSNKFFTGRHNRMCMLRGATLQANKASQKCCVNYALLLSNTALPPSSRFFLSQNLSRITSNPDIHPQLSPIYLLNSYLSSFSPYNLTITSFFFLKLLKIQVLAQTRIAVTNPNISFFFNSYLLYHVSFSSTSLKSLSR